MNEFPGWIMKQRPLGLGLLGALAWVAALGLATATRLTLADTSVDWWPLLGLAALAAASQGLCDTWQHNLLGAYRVGSIDEATSVIKSWVATSAVVVAANFFLFGRPVPTIALALSLPLALTTMLGARMSWSLFQRSLRRPPVDARTKKVIVFGAGEGGDQIIRAMLGDRSSRYVPVALLDDDTTKARRQIMGVRVRGTRHDIAAVKSITGADVLLIAIPSAKSSLIAEIDELGLAAGSTCGCCRRPPNWSACCRPPTSANSRRPTSSVATRSMSTWPRSVPT
ncbi:MAG: hypothetical protein R2733_26880 [Acidimicrobiales bacterium]